MKRKEIVMLKLLIVEDDSTISFGIKYALEHEGFSIDISKDLSSGKEMISSNEYSMILLDVTLPDGTGYELCQYIRGFSQVPIIFLTACDEEVNIVMGLDIGGDDYITKPFRIRELISRIKAVLRRKGNTSEENKKILKFGDLSIYT
ncbi:response regulator transcription factor, partial [Clostridioides difficile]|nr:response regulator transcription factor [Clostridioides difficile]